MLHQSYTIIDQLLNAAELLRFLNCASAADDGSSFVITSRIVVAWAIFTGQNCI
jgi:hypothetical protein